jgi:23S rRNA U2552 (ribose-2'-O)-methylase RlmE/FtsJ
MDKVSRAYHKMKEVFTRIDCLRLADTAQWTAIDVGAAPGGWYTPPPPNLPPPHSY